MEIIAFKAALDHHEAPKITKLFKKKIEITLRGFYDLRG